MDAATFDGQGNAVGEAIAFILAIAVVLAAVSFSIWARRFTRASDQRTATDDPGDISPYDYDVDDLLAGDRDHYQC